MSNQQLPALRLDLKLTPTAIGLKELQNWPDSVFTPDFAVAASGAVQIEIDGQLIGIHANQLTTVAVKQVKAGFNSWLPDYIGGFALNLGRATQKIHEGANQSRAALVDEPLALRFQRQVNNGKVQVTFEANTKPLRAVEVSETVLYAEVKRALQVFHAHLLVINPKLAKQRDVQELSGFIKHL